MRKIFFWAHLLAGTVTGAVILIMSVSGVLLTYERQMIEWADRGFRSSPGVSRLSPEQVLRRAKETKAQLPATLTVHSDSTRPVEAAFGRNEILYLDAYSGQVLGEGSKGIRQFFQSVTEWHRYLAMSGPSRAIGKRMTGVANLAFLLLALSGIYLWLPRKWTWPNVQAVLLFRGSLQGKARDFNWHNVIGIWSAVPLVFVILGALVISFPWATELVYTITGTQAPSAPPRIRESKDPADFTHLNTAWHLAEQQNAQWQTISLRVPSSNQAPFAFTIAESHRGRPDQRSSVTVHQSSGAIVQSETFHDFNRGRQVRSWLRFIHTGEALGIVGQTIAGIVTAGGAVLVWTGVALCWRRFRAWLARKKAAAAPALASNAR